MHHHQRISRSGPRSTGLVVAGALCVGLCGSELAAQDLRSFVRQTPLFHHEASGEDLVERGSTTLLELRVVGPSLEDSSAEALHNGKIYVETPLDRFDGGRAFVPSDGTIVEFSIDEGCGPIHALRVLSGGVPGRTGQRFLVEAACGDGAYARLQEVDVPTASAGETEVVIAVDEEQSEAFASEYDRFRFTFRDTDDGAGIYREIDIFSVSNAEPPSRGDTGCDETIIEGPERAGPGDYRVLVEATDCSGADIFYKFFLTKIDGDAAFPTITFESEWQLEPEISFRLSDFVDGEWAVEIVVDDDLAAGDVAFDEPCGDLRLSRDCDGTQIIVDPTDLRSLFEATPSFAAGSRDLASRASPYFRSIRQTGGAAPLLDSSIEALNDDSVYADGSEDATAGRSGFVPASGSRVRVDFDTDLHPEGYDVEEIAILTGSSEARLSQRVEVLFALATDPEAFARAASVVESRTESGELLTRLGRSGQLLASGIASLVLEFPEAGGGLASVYREIDVLGTPSNCDEPAGCAAVLLRRGDGNLDSSVDISDAIGVFAFLFSGGAPPSCADGADANDDGALDISDGVYTLNYLFQGGAPPPAPFPDCGVDPSPDGLPCAAVACA